MKSACNTANGRRVETTKARATTLSVSHPYDTDLDTSDIFLKRLKRNFQSCLNNKIISNSSNYRY